MSLQGYKENKMSLAHRKIHVLIQRHTDEGLSPEECASLMEHIENCPSCKKYMDDLQIVEDALRQTRNSRWASPPHPVDIQSVIQAATRTGDNFSNIFLTRLAVTSGFLAVLAVFMFQFSLTPGQTEVVQPPTSIPTPSLTVTNTLLSLPICPDVRYTVQADDSIARIAEKFGMPEAEIRAANGSLVDSLFPGLTLTIPTCGTTPTGTGLHPTGTVTLTPLFESASYTPDS